MRYALLIYTNETTDAQKSAAEQASIYEEYNGFAGIGGERIVGGDALVPTTSATTVRVRQGETLVTDGPFAETKEQLGGFYLVECANLDEAIALGAKIPGAKDGSVEIRPVMVFG